MGTMESILATVTTECIVLLIGIRNCSSSISYQVNMRSINSACCLCPGHRYYLSAWERGSSSSVWQCISRDHEAIDGDRKFISLEGLISSHCSSRSCDWPLACSPTSTDLEISNETHAPGMYSSNDQTSTDSKALCILLKGYMSGRAKSLQKFMVIAK